MQGMSCSIPLGVASPLMVHDVISLFNCLTPSHLMAMNALSPLLFSSPLSSSLLFSPLLFANWGSAAPFI